MTYSTRSDFAGFLQPANRTQIVDIGAYPIDGTPPYADMLQKGLCDVIGFEPQLEGFRKLENKPDESGSYYSAYYFDHAIADGNNHTIYHCKTPGLTSLLRPNPGVLALFGDLLPLGAVTHEGETWTSRLDDERLIKRIDYLKIDTQGSELMILQNGREKLKDCVAIQVEVPFIPLYHNMPSLGDINNELRSQGFILMNIAHVKHWGIAGGTTPDQIIDADFLYVRDYSKPELMTDEQLKQLALVMHYIYVAPGLADYCVSELSRRGVLQVAA